LLEIHGPLISPPNLEACTFGLDRNCGWTLVRFKDKWFNCFLLLHLLCGTTTSFSTAAKGHLNNKKVRSRRMYFYSWFLQIASSSRNSHFLCRDRVRRLEFPVVRGTVRLISGNPLPTSHNQLYDRSILGRCLYGTREIRD
jgi:hypothetical protein